MALASVVAGQDNTSLKTLMEEQVTLHPDTALHTLTQKLDSLNVSMDSARSLLVRQYDRIASLMDSLKAKASMSFLEDDSCLSDLKSSVTSLNDRLNKWCDSVSSKIMEFRRSAENKATQLQSVARIRDKLNGKLQNLSSRLGMSSVVSTPSAQLNISNPLASLPNGALKAIPSGINAPSLSGPSLDVGELPVKVPAVSEMDVAGQLKKTAVKAISASSISQGIDSEALNAEPQALKARVENEIRGEINNHFQGKEKELSKAMEEVSVLKQKYSSVKSLEQLPKRKPNTMRDLTFGSRLLPGVSMQMQRKEDLLCLDVNPHTGFRWTDALTIGAGWNHRIGFDKHSKKFATYEVAVFGPRVFAEYSIGRGFSPRLLIEAMNTQLPTHRKTNPPDENGRAWICGLFVGIKKQYHILRNVRGIAEVSVRLANSHDSSPYADVVNARFGFELPQKAKKR